VIFGLEVHFEVGPVIAHPFLMLSFTRLAFAWDPRLAISSHDAHVKHAPGSPARTSPTPDADPDPRDPKGYAGPS